MNIFYPIAGLLALSCALPSLPCDWLVRAEVAGSRIFSVDTLEIVNARI